jgi:hypothetical protein
MPRQTVVWTAIPQSVDLLNLRLAVVVSPRLRTDEEPPPEGQRLTLDQFPDFLDWPETVRGNLTFQVRLDDHPPLPATIVAPPSSPAPSELWKSLFRPTTEVVPYAFDDLADAVISSPDHVALDRVIRELYVSVATDRGLGGAVSKPGHGPLGQHPPFGQIVPGPAGSGGTDDDGTSEGDPEGGGGSGGNGGEGDGGAGGDTDFIDIDVDIEVGVGGGGPGGGGVGVGVDVGVGTGSGQPGAGGAIHIGVGGIGVDVGVGLGAPRSGDEPAPAPVGAGATTGPAAPETGLAPRGGAAPAGPGQAEPAGPTAPARSPDDPGGLFQRLRDFHSASENPPTPPTDFDHVVDFHQMVSLLGEHPELLRRLGLAVELEVAAGGLLGGLLGGGRPPTRVQVIPVWREPRRPTTNVSPRTACALDGNRFSATPRRTDPEIADGLLRLGDPTYGLLQYDVDGAGIKLGNMANSLLAPLTTPLPEHEGLSTLRSAGISVVRQHRHRELRGAFLRAKTLHRRVAAVQDSPEAKGRVFGAGPLFAEDLTLGYRADVWDDKSRRWHSLNRRDVNYTFLDPPDPGAAAGPKVAEADKEGYAEPAVFEKDAASAGTPRRLGVSPAVLTWDGWSLSAPRPRKHVSSANDGEVPVEPDNTARTPLRLEIRSAPVDGSLPRLRFGRTYHLRARAVDLAGKGLALSQGDPAALPHATGALRYARFEPVASPAIVLVAVPGGGESTERLVVSSDPDRFGTIWTGSTERHIAPPKAAQLLVETHGRFDGLSPEAGHQLAIREAGSFDRPLHPQDPPPHGLTIVHHPAAPPEGYVIRTDPRLQVPYLPDPLAAGALFVGLPGASEVAVPGGQPVGLTRTPFGGSWPDVAPFRFRLVRAPAGAPDAPPVVVAATAGEEAVLEVRLRPAETAKVLMSTFMTSPDASPANLDLLATLGVWQWIEAMASEEDKDRLRAVSLLGLNWLLMPSRELVLVHAVQRPVDPPTLPDPLVASKTGSGQGGGVPVPGQTFATVSTSVGVHGRSTGKVELVAEWVDPLDEPARAGSDPMVDFVPGRAPFTHPEVSLSPTDTSATFDQAQLSVGDTRHHRVHVRAVATSRFREYFPVTEDDAGKVPTDFTRPSHPEPTFSTAGLPAGPPAFEALDARLEGAVASVPSSARPVAPAVAYAVPTFGWERPADGSSSTRRCRGVRVYLERPWFSSGPGEMLGVVFLEGEQPAEGHPLKPLVTGWGADPAWTSSRPVPTHLGTENFGVPVVGGLSLEELPALNGEAAAAPTVSVAPFPVHYDRERELWFADVDVSLSGSYFPFLRLALARYQPDSLPGVELSTVARAPFVQLPPDCTTTVEHFEDAPDGRRRRMVTVNVATGGHHWQSGPDRNVDELANTRFEATVLRKRVGGGELDWEIETSPDDVRVLVPGAGSWQGIIPFGSDQAERRLVVRQLERYTLSKPPVVSELIPASVVQGDDRTLTIHGEGFRDPVTVDIADVSVLDVTFGGTTSLTVRALVDEELAAGPRAVVVTNPDGKSGTGTLEVTPLPPPEIREVRPSTIFLSDDEELHHETVEILGNNFRRGVQVVFSFVPPVSLDQAARFSAVPKFVDDHTISVALTFDFDNHQFDITVVNPNKASVTCDSGSEGHCLTVRTRFDPG